MKKLMMVLLSSLLFLAYEGAYGFTPCSSVLNKSGKVTRVSIGGGAHWGEASNVDPNFIWFWYKQYDTTPAVLLLLHPMAYEDAGAGIYNQLLLAYVLGSLLRVESCMSGKQGDQVVGLSVATSSSYGN
jgi:hypothetical protein